MTNPVRPTARRARRRSIGIAIGVGLASVVAVGGCAGGDGGRVVAVGEPTAFEGTGAPDDGSGSTERADERASTAPLEIDGSLPDLPDGDDDPAIGSRLPSLRGPGLDGDEVSIDPSDGAQLVVVVAHWCPHCQREVPQLVAAIDDGVIPASVRVTAVSTAVDEIRGNFPPVSWLTEEGWPAPVLADDDAYSAATALGVTGFPFIVAVGGDGRVVARTSGELTLDDYRVLVDLVTAT